MVGVMDDLKVGNRVVPARRGAFEFNVPAVTVAHVRPRRAGDAVEGRGRWAVELDTRSPMAALLGFDLVVSLGLRIYRTRAAARQAARALSVSRASH